MSLNPVITDTLLLVMAEEDEFVVALSRQLQQAGHKTLCCSMVQAMALLERELPLMAVLCLPVGEAGPEWVQQCRQLSDRPLLAIAADESAAGRIAALSRGADDALSAPADVEECLLRIQALLRRYSPGPAQPARILRADGLCLDRQQMQVSVGQAPVTLTPIQFRLLWTLVAHRERVLDKPFLYRQVLEKPFSNDDRSLDMHLSRVRRKLVQAGLDPERLKTVHGRGYGFV
ncbi:response regulator transcription factor [Oceanimonas sp. CHS3-5]|uniref:response regulator transcription factor n=1 Tax=Oceanimonas sp. CHS3-5 TaxID=3068186 RepID=UPI00273F0AB7|nr:response regulator transcription factor [Oceanimonas sp. CHS3-5]MDP5291802.1 response regulator transcription factor [Oceanimonas sp. CHS3-5]